MLKLYTNYQIELNALHRSCCASASRGNYFHTYISTLLGKTAVVGSCGYKLPPTAISTKC